MTGGNGAIGTSSVMRTARYLLPLLLLQACTDVRQANEVYDALKSGPDHLEVRLTDLFGPSWETVCSIIPGRNPRKVLANRLTAGGKWTSEQVASIPDVDEDTEYLWKLVLLSRTVAPRVIELHKQDFTLDGERCLDASYVVLIFNKAKGDPPKRPDQFQFYELTLKLT